VVGIGKNDRRKLTIECPEFGPNELQFPGDMSQPGRHNSGHKHAI